MGKIVSLYLKDVKYSGDSIGSNIFIRIESAGQSATTDVKIKRGYTAEINKEIAYFETDKDLTIPIKIKITEKDILFDDVGDVHGIMKIDLTAPLPQTSIFEIKIAESKGGIGRRVAVFHITLEATGAVRYVEDVDEKGWLEVLLKADAEKRISLPIYLKVQLDRLDENREYFTILEGALKNIQASVLLGTTKKSRFSKINPHTKQAKLTYSISKKILKVSRKKYTAIDYPDAVWTKGIYDIEIPDYPHEGGLQYLEFARHATVWFRISHHDDRYLHTGNGSLGCITIIEKNRWEELFSSLISARKGDDISIGILKVID
jgi:hypothetical protein